MTNLSYLYPIQIVDVYSFNTWSAKEEKAKGTRGVIFKGGQGGSVSVPKNYIFDAETVGLPWGIYWVIDSRTNEIAHMKAIKETFPDQNFGNLGWWWDCEKPKWDMLDDQYWATPYAGNALIEKVLDLFKEWTSKPDGIYTSPGFAKLLGWNGILFKLKSLYWKLSKKPLWTAQYNSSVVKPDSFAPFPTWEFWQYTPDPDYSYYNGTEESFNKRFNLDVLPPPPDETGSVLVSKELWYGAVDYEKRTKVFRESGLTPYHVIKVDKNKAHFFVSPYTGNNYVPRLLEKFKQDVGWNGDGWNTNPKTRITTITGYAMSNGQPYGVLNKEETIWIDKDENFSTIRPPQEKLNMAFSIANWLVKNGEIQPIDKGDDWRGRTAVGWNVDSEGLTTSVTVIIVEGKDYYEKFGASFKDTAQLFVDANCDFAVMLDGGLSTTLARMKDGKPILVNKTYGEEPRPEWPTPLRPVAQLIGFKIIDGTVDDEDIPPEGEVMEYEAILDPTPRLTHDLYDTRVKPKMVSGYQFNVKDSFTTPLDDPKSANRGVTFLQVDGGYADGYWVPLVYAGKTWVKSLGVVPPPPEGAPKKVVVQTPDGSLYESTVFTKIG